MKSRRKFLNSLALAFPIGILPFTTQANKKVKPYMIHQVYFWLNEGVDLDEFKEGARKLGSIKTVAEFKLGTPAPTEIRDVIDSSYDVALNMVFESIESQNEYQVDPIHLEFIEKHSAKWREVKVYDFVLE